MQLIYQKISAHSTQKNINSAGPRKDINRLWIILETVRQLQISMGVQKDKGGGKGDTEFDKPGIL